MAPFDEYSAMLGARIRFLRKRAGLSLRTFGMMIGVHHNQILLIEQGKSNPSLQTLLRIAEGLDVSLSDLLPERRGEAGSGSYWFSQRGKHAASEVGGPVFGATGSHEHGDGSEGEDQSPRF